MMFASRSTVRPPRWTEWRIRAFLLGATLAVAGMATEMDWLVRIAIAILVIGFVLRFVPEPGESDAASGHEEHGTE